MSRVGQIHIRKVQKGAKMTYKTVRRSYLPSQQRVALVKPGIGRFVLLFLCAAFGVAALVYNMIPSSFGGPSLPSISPPSVAIEGDKIIYETAFAEAEKGFNLGDVSGVPDVCPDAKYTMATGPVGATVYCEKVPEIYWAEWSKEQRIEWNREFYARAAKSYNNQ